MTANVVALADSDQPRPPEFSDEALALRFAERYADQLRYVATWSRWLSWTGSHWRFDDTLLAFDRARMTCRQAAEAARGINNPSKAERIASGIASAKTVAAVERLAKADRRLAAAVSQWDKDAYLLATPSGTINLVTGEMRPADPFDYHTKCTAVAPAEPGTACPLWTAHLERITAGDADLILYLRRVAGYALTGCTDEHSLWFAYGTGRNGKGVFLNTLSRCLGDYATVASMETFIDSKNPQHPTDLAMLRGARLVTAQETEEGRRWAEAKIKVLTGGDPITARFMRQDFFTYEPTFKLFIAGNHKPGLRGVDEAMRARLKLIPFTVTIPEEERDPDLPRKLEPEWPAILRWAIDGCLEWQEQGLKPPKAVREATDEYLAQEDAFTLWLEECCERQDRRRENTSDLYGSWKEWAERAGEFPGSSKRFAQAMDANGFPPSRQSGTGSRGFGNIALRRSNYADENGL